MKKLLQKNKFIAFVVMMIFTSFSYSQSAGFNSTFIVLSLNGGGNTFYDLQATTGNPDFNGANLGAFCQGSNGIVFKGAEHNNYKCGSCDISSTRLNYRIYPTASPSGSFVVNNIGFTSDFNNGCGGKDQRWSSIAYNVNLLSGLPAGNYTLEVYSEQSTTCSGTQFASNGGLNYKATFTVNPLPTLASVTATAACENGSSFVTMTGLLPNTSGTFFYTNSMTGSVQYPVSGTSSASGTFTFNTPPLPLMANGAIITIVSVTATSTSCSTSFTGKTVSVVVNPNVTYYRDFDGDSFGSSSVTQVSCSGIPVGYVANSLDSNDNLLTYVDADGDGFGSTTLAPSGVSNSLDSNDNLLTYIDADGDGFGSTTLAPSGVTNTADCNDNQLRYLDADNDGFGSTASIFVACGGSLVTTDCNDNAASINPGAVDICGDGIDNDCNGVIDNVGLPGGCIPVLTSVQGSQCGTTLATIDQYVYANSVPGGAQGYRFRVTKMVAGVPSTNPADVQTIDTFLRLFRITQLASYAFDTTYQVEVSIRRNNVWQPFYGTPCTVTTPATTTSIQSSQCGSTLTSMTDVIFANGVPFSTGYRFRVTNVLTSQVQIIDRNIRDIRMSLLASPAAEFNTTYTIEVAIRNTDGTYLPYGSACNVTTPSFPTTQVQTAQCDYNVTSNSEIIYADSFNGISGYRFKFVNGSFTYVLERLTRTFTLSMVPGIVSGQSYNVQVSVLINGVWGPYGKVCSLTTPGASTSRYTTTALPSTPSEVAAEFKAVAYPNPFAENFKLKVTTDSQVAMQVRVYDMIGKLVEDKMINASDIQNFELGNQYPSGVYNVIVSQESNTKTLRVIKR